MVAHVGSTCGIIYASFMHHLCLDAARCHTRNVPLPPLAESNLDYDSAAPNHYNEQARQPQAPTLPDAPYEACQIPRQACKIPQGVMYADAMAAPARAFSESRKEQFARCQMEFFRTAFRPR